VTAAIKTRYVDVSNPDLAVDCPRCGLKTARFVDHCRNCSYKLWPSSVMASAAFKAWRAADPVPRSRVSRFDMEYPVEVDNTVDYTARAHQLGIHLSPNSNWPFVICFGLFFLALAAIPLPNTATRIVLAVIGGVIFLWGVVGWVVIDDVQMFPSDEPAAGDEVHH
jgi:hypothetical protein